MSELLPCPFCGGEADMKHVTQLWEPRNSYWAQCGNCRMSGKHYFTEAEAIAAWNSRAERTCYNTHENRWFKCSACGYGFTDLYADDENDIMSEHIYEDSDMENERYHVIPFGSMREEIVRCRDCENFDSKRDGCWWFAHAERQSDYSWADEPSDVEPDGFCAWASRRDA